MQIILVCDFAFVIIILFLVSFNCVKTKLKIKIYSKINFENLDFFINELISLNAFHLSTTT